MNYHFKIFCLCIFLIWQCVDAQEYSAGFNISSPNPNAVLHLVSPNGDQGLLIPQLTAAQRDAMSLSADENGLIIYVTDDSNFYYWDGSTWAAISNTDQQTLDDVLSRGSDASGLSITNLADPTNAQDAATKNYVDSQADSDNQTLALSGTNLTISAGNTIDISSVDTDTDDQTLSLTGTNLSIADGNTVDISVADTDDQTLSLTGTNLSIADGNTIDISSIDTDTDDQTLSLAGTNLSIADGNTVDISVADTDDQTLSLTGTNLSIADGNTIDISSVDTDTDDQTLSLTGTNLSIADGNTVDISVADTDDQTLSLTGTNLSIADGNTIDISSVDTDTDDQTLSLTGTNLSIADGNTVDISVADTDDQTLSLTGTNLSIADGNTIDISSVDTDTDDQTLSLTGTNLSIADGNTVDISVADTDDQTLSLTGTNLSIADGNTIDISSVDTDTDDQTLSLTGTNLSIADGNTIDISSVDTDTDDQTLSLTGTNLSIADGNTVDISVADTDDQTLSLTGTNLSIADGNTIDISSVDTDTDDQTLSLTGTNLSIADGNTVDISVADTDDQTLSLTGTNLSIADGNTIDISSVDTDTDDQTLSLTGTNLSIADGNTVDISTGFGTAAMLDVGTGANQIVQLNASGELPAVDGSNLTNLTETGDIESVVAGTGLTGGATTGDATLNVDVGTGANQIVQLNASGELPAVDGSNLTNLTETGDIESVVAGTGLTGGATTGDATLNVDVGTGANQIIQLNASGELPAVDGSNLTNLTETGDIESVVAGTGLTGGATTGDVTLNVDVGTGANQIIQLNASGELPAVDGSNLTNLTETGDVESVVAGTGLTGGATTGDATLNVDVGTGANQIVQLNASGELPAVDGSNLTGLTITPTTTTLSANNFDASTVGDVVFLNRENTGDQTFSNIINGTVGQEITFISNELGVAFTDKFILGGNVVLGNRDQRPLEPGASLTLKYDGTDWVEVAGTYSHRYRALQAYSGTISVTIDNVASNNGVFEDIIHIESGSSGTITFPAANPDGTNGITWGREITIITESTSAVNVTGGGLSFVTEDGSVSTFPMSYTNGGTYAATFVYRGGSTWLVSNQSVLNPGDMAKATYDGDNDGIVDDAELVNGLTVQTAVPVSAIFTDNQNLTSVLDNGSNAGAYSITNVSEMNYKNLLNFIAPVASPKDVNYNGNTPSGFGHVIRIPTDHTGFDMTQEWWGRTNNAVLEDGLTIKVVNTSGAAMTFFNGGFVAIPGGGASYTIPINGVITMIWIQDEGQWFIED